MAMIALPEGFQFSPSSLQDFVDCRYRFWLRYVKGVDWPALQSEPALESERRLQLGMRFHQLAQAYFCGVPAEDLETLLEPGELSVWWASLQERVPAMLPPPGAGAVYAELQLSAPLADCRLTSKLDLACRFPDGHWIIFDWKTSQKMPARSWLEKSLQTRLYPYLLVRAGQALNQGEELSPEQVRMLYWFPAYPDQPQTFAYSAARFRMDEDHLSGLLATIKSLDEDEYVKTEQLERCRFCVYRSLCDRGVAAGSAAEFLEETPDAAELRLDFEQIAEIGF